TYGSPVSFALLASNGAARIDHTAPSAREKSRWPVGVSCASQPAVRARSVPSGSRTSIWLSESIIIDTSSRLFGNATARLAHARGPNEIVSTGPPPADTDRMASLCTDG